VRPDLSSTLPGVAVSVALMPPLAVVGYGLAKFDADIISGSLMLYIINVIGIVLAGILSFSLINVSKKKKVADKTIKKEDKRVEAEREKVEEFKESVSQ
jgi:uncharacterized membrane protein